MKRLFLLYLFISTQTFVFSQSWNFIGSSTGIANATEVDIEISTNGVLFAAYIDASNSNKISVRKWNNGAWQLVGTAGISSPNASGIKLILHNETPIVAAKIDDTYDRIECHRFNGTNWTSLFNNYIQINTVSHISKDFDISCNSAGDVFLTYYNPDYQNFTHEGLITLKSGSPAVIGGENIDVNSEYLSAVSSVATSGNNLFTLFEADMDMDYGINLSTISTSTYSNSTYEYGTDAKKIILEKDLNSSFYSCSHITDQNSQKTLSYRAFNGVSTLGTALNIISSSPNLVDYDLVTDGTTGYVFYRNSTTNYFHSFTAGMTPGALSTISSGTTLAPSDATSHSVETYYGVHVIAYISGGKFYVKEYNQAANIEDWDYFVMCEGTAFNNNASNSIYLLDPNYSHANISMTVTSQNVSVIPNSAVDVTGTGLNYSVFITSTNDVTSPTTVDLQFQLWEDGTVVDTKLIPIVVNPKPVIAFTNTINAVCENASPINLNNWATPTGGIWSGTGITNNTFYPSYPSTANVAMNYTKTNQYGCTSSDQLTFVINQIPDLNVTTTSSDCNQNTGSASVAITNGQSPYNIYWSNGSTLSNAQNLAAGQYLVSVTDANNCLSTATAMVGSNGFTQTGVPTGTTCFGTSNGSVNVTVTGGTAPLSYAWSNGSTTEDITGLIGGPYELTITDAQGCVSTATYIVQEPQQIMLNQMTITQPTCATLNGQVVASFNGGTAPYNYVWKNASGVTVGTNSATLSAVGAGTYTCNITDVNGCTFSSSALVSNASGPVLVIDTIMASSCAGDGQIQLSVISGSPASYLWTNGATTQDITNLNPGFYSVSITGTNGCVTVLGGTVGSALPDPVSICLVTVDSATNTNLVIWEKPVTNAIDHFNIYRETSQAGLYQLVGAVDYDDESIYNDLVASPNVRSWRYKMTSVDACGTESEMSAHHKTIHLIISQGLGNDINLYWDNYEGFNYSSFVLRKHTNATGWTPIQTIPNNLFTFMDQALDTDGLYYEVTVDAPSICSSTKMAQDFNTTRSNRDNRLSTGEAASITELLNQVVTIYPNPANNFLNIDNGSNQVIEARIVDQMGRILSSSTLSPGQTKLDCGKLAVGIYNIELISMGAKTLKRFAIER